jgi:hypothetical protein
MNIPNGWQIDQHDNGVIVVQKHGECGYAASVDVKNIASTTLKALARDMLAGVPVPPAGVDVEVEVEVEVLGHMIDDGTAKSYHKAFPHWAAGYEVTELVDRADVTRLQAELCARAGQIGSLAGERDALKAEVERQEQTRLALLREREELLKSRRMFQSELTKARELLGGMLFAFDDGVGREWSAPLLDEARKFCPAVEFQSAPAAKGEEPLCLLCLDEKTVTGPKAGDLVRDCPDCCGDEG